MKTYLIIACLLPLFAVAQERYTIKATASHLPDSSKVFLIYETEGRRFTDSALITNGRFEFKGTIKYPVFSSLYLNKNPYVHKPARGEKTDGFGFFLEPGTLNMQTDEELSATIIKGSVINRQQQEVLAELKKFDPQFAALRKQFAALPAEKQKDKAVIDSVTKLEDQINYQKNKVHLNFARQHPESYLSVISLAYIAAQPGFEHEAGEAFKRLPLRYQKSPEGKKIALLLASQSRTQIGRPATDFAQPTPEGKIIRLSDFKGKYVLLDFWASWCKPCREEKPNLIAAYQKYHDKGFEILSVSLDVTAQRDQWVKAIATDHLTWPQVADLKGWDNLAAQLYGVRAVPANFLINPSGKIIGKDLQGKDLTDKLTILDRPTPNIPAMHSPEPKF